MKKFIALFVMVFSFASFAKETVSFTYFGNEGGRQSYYACDYVEGQTEYYLELFGATDIEVYCHGGIQPWGSVQPVSINAKFNLPVIAGNSVESVKVQGDTWNPACGVNVRIVQSLLKKFTNVEVVKKSDSCAFHNSNYSYQFNIAR